MLKNDIIKRQCRLKHCPQKSFLIRKEVCIMSIENARTHLSKFNMADRIIEFDVSSATVELAAAALGCEPGRIAKTMSFLIDEAPILIVTAGDAKIDNQKYKAVFHKKAKMLTAEQAENLIGHAVGGICPFGVKPDVKVYLDESLKRYDIVYPAGGSSNSAVKLSIDELALCSEADSWIDVCRTAE